MAATRPRIASGVEVSMSTSRTTILRLSKAPKRLRRSNESQKTWESPKPIMTRPKPATAARKTSPTCLQHVGLVFLAAVAGFGLVMIGFGLSHVFWLSLLLLSLFGALDSLSMVVRDVLMLTSTPDAMRGRVAAIEGVCTSASNQLGGL